MGEVAARNMTGAKEPFAGVDDERLRVGKGGQINSPFWEH